MTQKFIRKNILTPMSNNDTNYICTFENPDVYWYAYGVYKLSQKPFKDRDSWKFMAAIHGFDNHIWAKQGNYNPEHLVDLFPSKLDQDVFWDQCQHGTWYFLPWHRGYLLALEVMLRKEIINGGGPENWSLPYWDFTQKTTLTEEGKEKLRAAKRYAPEQSYTPEAFLLPEFTFTETIKGIQQAPQTVANPLYVKDRYNIYDLMDKQEKIEHLLQILKDLPKSPEKIVELISKLLAYKPKKSTSEEFKPEESKHKEEKLKKLLQTVRRDLEGFYEYLVKVTNKLELFDPNSISAGVDNTLTAPYFEFDSVLGGSFGGPKTGFCHGTGTLSNQMLGEVLSTHGLAENMPHDIGHIIAGGFGVLNHLLDKDDETILIDLLLAIDPAEEQQNLQPGLLTQPDTAGLDPLFYVHHVNQDRVWSSWASLPNRENPEDHDWLNGPNFKDSQFAMPIDSKQIWHYVPNDVKDNTSIFVHGVNVSYDYDQLIQPKDDKDIAKILAGKPTLVGANTTELELKDFVYTLTIALNEDTRGNTHEEYAYLLSLQGITSQQEIGVLFVGQSETKNAKAIPLFGLKNASDKSLPGQGFGMNKTLNITEWISDNQSKLELEIYSLNPFVDIQILQVMVYKVETKDKPNDEKSSTVA